MRLIFTVVVSASLLPLAACVDPADRPDPTQSALITPPMMSTRPATYECDESGRIVVRPLGEDGKTVVLALASREVQLKSVPTEEGRKYSDGQTVLLMNGPKATLLLAGTEEPESCEN